MLLSEHKQLKLEIKSLPEKEKDKLLLRLIAKDKVLTEHLHFKLLEDEEDLTFRHQQILDEIDEVTAGLNLSKRINSKEVLLGMRRLSGSINRHVKVTKNVPSEMELRMHLLGAIPIRNRHDGIPASDRFHDKLLMYIVRFTVSALNKYKKLHEDLQYDLKERVNAILEKIYDRATFMYAADADLPKRIE